MNILTPAIKNQLKRSFPDIVELDVNMATVSQWRIGGCVAALASPRTSEEFSLLLSWIELNCVPSLVIGNTTNLLFADGVIDAVIIRIGPNYSGFEINGLDIVAKGGTYVPCLARKSMQHGLTGLEHTIG